MKEIFNEYTDSVTPVAFYPRLVSYKWSLLDWFSLGISCCQSVCSLLIGFLHRIVLFLLLSAYYVSDTVLSIFGMLSHLICTTAMLHRYYQYPQFTLKEVESFIEIK